MKKTMRVLTSSITVLMIALVAGIFVSNIPAYAGSAASSAIMQYEKGMISEAELEQRLKDIGYSGDEIRQVKALTGVPDYQEDYTQSNESIDKNTEENSSPKKISSVSTDQTDNIMLAMGIAGASVVAAIVVAFVKRPL